MKNKNLLNNNEGFSLVELIVVVTIILVFSGASFISVSLINNGRAKDGATSFNSEVATCLSRAKGERCNIPDDVIYENGATVVSGALTADDVADTSRFAVKLYKHTDGKYYLQTGYMYTDSSGIQKYIYSPKENKSAGKGRCLTANIVVKFTDPSAPDDADKSFTILGDNVKYVVFRKDGSCSEGAGKYEFTLKSGRTVSTIVINKNGSRQTK